MTLILHQPVTVPAGTTSIYPQFGEIVGTAHSRFDPYCEFRAKELKNMPQTINPDCFLITRAGTNICLIMQQPVQTAMKRIVANMSGGDATTDVIYTIEMNLYSEKQPDVILLGYGGAEDHPAKTYAPTLQEIRASPGKIATLESCSASPLSVGNSSLRESPLAGLLSVCCSLRSSPVSSVHFVLPAAPYLFPCCRWTTQYPSPCPSKTCTGCCHGRWRNRSDQ